MENLKKKKKPKTTSTKQVVHLPDIWVNKYSLDRISIAEELVSHIDRKTTWNLKTK